MKCGKGISRTFILAITIVFLVAANMMSLYLYFHEKNKPLSVPTTTNVPSTVIKSPDLIMGNKSKFFYALLPEENVDHWMGEAYYIYGPIDDDYGVITFPPLSKYTESAIEMSLHLTENKNYTLVVKMGNIAGKIIAAGATGCDDSIIKIKLLNFANGSEYLIDDVIVNSKEGWIEKKYDLSLFKGGRYALRIEGWAGGPCGDWAGEWPAIAYLNLV